jgi:hypothetical protein
MEHRPHLLHARKLTDRKPLNSCILEETDEKHLHGIELFHGQRLFRIHQMRGRMRRGGAVKVLARQTSKVIEGIRQVNDACLDERLVPFASFVVARGRAHKEVAPPEGAQIEIEFALAVYEQGAPPFLLEHGLRVGALEIEIRELRRKIAHVCLRAPQRPASQTSERQLGKQPVQMRQHRAQSTRNLGGELVYQAQIAAQQLCVTQTLRRRRQRIEHELDDLAAHHRGKFHGTGNHVLDHVLADFLDDRRHLLDVRDDEFVAASEL